MKTTKTIWSSWWIIDDEMRENYEREMQEIDENFEPTEERWAKEVNSFLDDERVNLDEYVDGVIIAFASVGRWNGRFNGYKIYDSNIKNILSTDCDDAEWFAEEHNIRGTLYHHDGHHNVLYRVAKDEETAEELAEKIYCNELDEEGFIKKTKSLYPYVAEIYGWK